MSATEARRSIDAAYGALSPVKDLAQVRDARRHLIAAKRALELPTPAPAPRTLVKGAIVVTAGNMNVDLLRAAGIGFVAVELNAANQTDFGTARWQGFAKGWFVVSRGNDGDNIAQNLEQARFTTPDATFAVIDTESHKTDSGGSLQWTTALYAALRSKLGVVYPLFNITYGINSSPAVVNHAAFRRYNVTPIWEAYRDDGTTLGIDRTASKAELEGWVRPHIALGDKTLVTDALDLKAGAALGLGGIWLYGADMGPAQEALSAGVDATLRGLA